MKPHKSRIFFIVLMLYIMGVLVYSFFVDPGIESDLLRYENSTITAQGYIARPPEHRGSDQRLTIRLTHSNDRILDQREHLLVYAPVYPLYAYGDSVQIRGKVTLPKAFEDFDYQAYLAKDAIHAIVYSPSIEHVDDVHSGLSSIGINLKKGIFALRNRFEMAVNLSLVEPHAAFVNGILLGIRSNIPQDLQDDFATTGTTHILAISGYNITIVARIIMGILVVFMMRGRAFWMAVLGIMIFTVMVGAEASVVRAAIMGIIVLIAQKAGRLNAMHNALALAAVIMLMANPLLLRYDVGFQLSFMATIGLIYGSPIVEPYFSWITNRFDLREITVMTLTAQLFVLPLLLYHFGTLSLVSLPTNILILPFMPILMLFGFFTGIAGLIMPLLGQIISVIPWLISTLVLGVVRFAANIPAAAFDISLPWYGGVVLYGILFAGFRYLWRTEQKQSS